MQPAGEKLMRSLTLEDWVLSVQRGKLRSPSNQKTSTARLSQQVTVAKAATVTCYLYNHWQSSSTKRVREPIFVSITTLPGSTRSGTNLIILLHYDDDIALF